MILVDGACMEGYSIRMAVYANLDVMYAYFADLKS